MPKSEPEIAPLLQSEAAASDVRNALYWLWKANPEQDTAKGPAIYSLSVVEPERFRLPQSVQEGRDSFSQIAVGSLFHHDITGLTWSQLEEILRFYIHPGHVLAVELAPSADAPVEERLVRIIRD